MTHTYELTGMTCENCEAKVKTRILSVNGITDAVPSREKNEVTISMDTHVPVEMLQEALGGPSSKYRIRAKHSETTEKVKGWIATYKPILTIFAYILGLSLAIAGNDINGFMRVFMAGFFITFSFFKMLNLRGFADSYRMYDVIARRVPSWAYLYAFIELGLGFAYVINFDPLITNIITLSVMSVSIIGVLQTVLNKRSIQCACLGAVFNLPMSTVTIVEDAMMIGMSGMMLVMM
jgi:copper chaperone CopZ